MCSNLILKAGNTTESTGPRGRAEGSLLCVFFIERYFKIVTGIMTAKYFHLFVLPWRDHLSFNCALACDYTRGKDVL